MSIETVKAYFRALGREQDVREFPVSSATVELAAQALQVEPERIAKTLSFVRDEGGILIVCAGDARIDNQKFKAEFGMKAKMLSLEDALRLTGHPVGGVCPFAVGEGINGIYLDVSLKRFDTVFPACGSANSAIELTCEELFEYSKADRWVDVCKAWA